MWVALSLSSFIRTVYDRLVGKVKQKLHSRAICKQEPSLFGDGDRIQGKCAPTILLGVSAELELFTVHHSRC